MAKIPDPIPSTGPHSPALALAPGGLKGIFGPKSLTWRINRESALFLASGRAAVLQLLHPWVTTALLQHSRVLNDPIRRFHNTFRSVFAMIFGAMDQALASSQNLYALHSRIQGKMEEGVGRFPADSPYRATETKALLWVYATLVESALLAYEFALPPLLALEKEQYYQESFRMAALFGIPQEALPQTWTAFEAYNQEMGNSDQLGVNDRTREMASAILSGAGSWIRPPSWFRSLTTFWLPERFRQELNLPFSSLERLSVEKAQRNIRLLYPHLPKKLRYVGPYLEADARLRGKKAGMLIRANNRFWIGQPELPYDREMRRKVKE